jgi:hypothetical protein
LAKNKYNKIYFKKELMSNFQNSNKILNNKNTKYSLDEIEISENNTTHNDSLHKEKKIYFTSKKKI